MTHFQGYLGIDYSGAATAESSLPGLVVYQATPHLPPVPIPPPPSPCKHWTRRGLAEWLARELRTGPPRIVGIDHGFSVPLRYFEAHRLPPDWAAFLDDFQRHWPTDRPHTCVDFVRDGLTGLAMDRNGSARWRRLTEERCGAKSVFHFDVPGSVAKSTHAGLPWLRYLRRELGERVHFWPFDGWEPPVGRSVIAEAYPALWSKGFGTEGRNAHQHDAYSITRWLQERDQDQTLSHFLQPDLGASLRTQCRLEGWILGVE